MTRTKRIQNLKKAERLIREAAGLIAATVPGSRWEENGAESYYRDALLALVNPDKDGDCLPAHIADLLRRIGMPDRVAQI